MKRTMPKRNRLRKLNLFKDRQSDLLCVGGKISEALLGLDEKHPAILSSESHFKKLLIRAMHIPSLRRGPVLASNSVGFSSGIDG